MVKSWKQLLPMTTQILIAIVVILLTILLGSFLEWFVHGPFMHGKLGKVVGLRQGHEEHHSWFGSTEGYANEKHGTSVALPTWAAFATVGFMSIPGWLLSYLTDHWIIMWCMTGTSLAYYVAYQYVHTCMHIPKNRWLERTRWFQRKNAYHKVHHVVDEKFERFVNICIICDWADRFFRTMYRHRAKDTGAAT
jgi:hypothetical protein